ncbi:2-dehydro-3-deoxy-D-gluconate 5-dehydrogenase KduD [Georgenia alba]|uniref:2-dehydro-3-deoxy-D-gluconate 5-dehydrogenase KduD n=1 Tax=Georgenia alba TaxID=2233858 RepID=A0ABW2Q9Y4_9MICO
MSRATPVTADLSLTGRVAMVTGAGTGIGRAIAVGLAGAGADVVGLYRTHQGDTEGQVAALGRRYLGVRCDLAVAGEADLAALVRDAREELGGLDVLVNNAGIIRRSPALEHSREDWDAVLETNLGAGFRLSQAFARALPERTADGRGSRGKIINIASMLSFQGGISTAAYTASKSALLGVTRLLANEWAPLGINVNAIAPGYVETEATEALRADRDRSEAILGRIPAGRWGRPDDLQGAAVLLASAASDYIHGAVLPVDGGWLAR